jgi:hypothetical protein
LLDGDTPCVALPYSRTGEIAGLREAEQVAFVVSDARSLRAGSRGLAALGAPSVAEDLTGDMFTVELLGQELRKYPPSRTLADSPLLCRENWWWLPRIIVRLDRVRHTVDLPARTDPARHALLARERDGLPALHVVETAPETEAGIALTEPEGAALRGDGAPALVLGYDYSMPDLELWESWSLRGTLLGDALRVTKRSGEPGTELGPLPLVRRVRRHRALARACRRNIAAAEHARRR